MIYICMRIWIRFHDSHRCLLSWFTFACASRFTFVTHIRFHFHNAHMNAHLDTLSGFTSAFIFMIYIRMRIRIRFHDLHPHSHSCFAFACASGFAFMLHIRICFYDSYLHVHPDSLSRFTFSFAFMIYMCMLIRIRFHDSQPRSLSLFLATYKEKYEDADNLARKFARLIGSPVVTSPVFFKRDTFVKSADYCILISCGANVEPIERTIIKRIQAPTWASNNLVALNEKQHMDADQIGLFAVLTNITLAYEEGKKGSR